MGQYSYFLGQSVIPLIVNAGNNGSIWWDENWAYSRVLTIVNPHNSYQMKMTIGKSQGGEINCNGHCKNDFSDIRFINPDNNSQLSYWIENYSNGNQATFWVKLPSAIESHPTIVIYYGNTAATSTSDGEATFWWFDDFQTDTTGEWTKVEDFQHLGWFFHYQHYQVFQPKPGYDIGADLIVKSLGTTTVIQAKQEQENTGVLAIQQVNTARIIYHADRALAITTSQFTEPALKLAKTLNVKCLDGKQLLKEFYNNQFFYAPETN